uniref:Uncharacterized protein n=1 Tax=Arion vulgaris TaxID=1028688 RepID=A0A0B6YBG7_9EUPU
MNQSSVSLVKPGGKLESATNVEKREDVINEEQLLPNTTIVTHCIYRNDTETLKRCFEDPTSPYKDQMNELLNQRDDDGKSPLDVAAILERTDIVKMLIQFGADVNIFTSKGYSCLHYAALWGRLEVLQILVENGGNLYQRNIHGETPRDAALRYNQTESATYLELAG